MNAKTLLVAIGVTTVLSVAPLNVARAEFPEKPITMIVPWDPGGSTDLTGRALAKAAETYLGQPIVVVNRPGASTVIGMAELANAKPDGYTIGTLSNAAYLISLQGRALPFHPINSFSYISYYGDNLIGIAVLTEAPWKTLKELTDDGKANPGKIKYGTGAVGATQHLTTEALQQSTGAKFVHVPLKGSAAAMPALLGKHVDFLTEVSVWAPFIESKQVRLLAVNTPARVPRFADVPTLSEFGYRTLRPLQAVIAPGGVPEPIRAKLEKAFRQALSEDGFKRTMDRLSMAISDMPGADVKKLVEQQYELAGKLISDIGLAPK